MERKKETREKCCNGEERERGKPKAGEMKGRKEGREREVE